ncbi:unnamed protein product [Echinostoma caproni]|uniref:Large ribosomal subunit protein mL44 endonuclease domain-containing protein n=1 Tax=Echinostoma caproni TaxID=27848 RepID=A0A3P8GN16_9TREM|nr:unnamed protein product [Echinostoma caproni]
MHGAYPRLPEECVTTVVDYLLSDDTLAYTASTIGLKDLVLYKDSKHTVIPTAPPSCQVLANALLAIIAVIADESSTRAMLFIRDFLLTPLGDADLLGELIVFDKPMQMLADILASEKRPPPEPRNSVVRINHRYTLYESNPINFQ